MTLSTVWFILIGVLWAGYLLLEGFDFGVGILMPLLARNDDERTLILKTIGPVWDGNEVWLLTAGGATFAAFPEWYATLFSGFYLALLLILLALIVRGIALEYRAKLQDVRWQRTWDVGIAVGSFVPAVLWGVAFGNIVRGVPLDAHHQFVGTFFGLLNPFALLGGVTTLLLFLTHGAVFLALKTDGVIRVRAGLWAATLAVPTLAVAGVFALWTQLAYSVPWTWAAVVAAAGALGALVWATRARREGWAFVFSGLAIVSAVVLLFGSLFPDVLPALDGVNSLTVHNASSTPYTLRLMTWVAGALVPFVLAYQSWTYWVFRRRLGGPAPAPSVVLAPPAAP